ncbi:protein CNPPD1 isoform X1 [Camponotus floridanus]|uniref:protein CNPPD1 isoform X1 n=1 Tax=Camponotus floridanus TaxID=104421 RepID=UPI00059EB1F9|nr:protein CNPPD1 isoform X1 [Camponotus floridanus]
MTNSWRDMNGPVNSMLQDLEHNEFLKRIRKSLYYSKLPKINCLSLPVTELAAEIFTEAKSGHTLEKLDVEEASRISRNACVSPCSLVLALLYIERLKNCNPEYLQQVAPSELFLVSLMVASKFLHDDGEEDEVFNKEWANSGQVTISRMNKLEKDFLAAIDWTVLVQHQDFWEKLQRLEKDVAYREVQKRGWCSYTELNCLLNSVQLIAIAQTLINVSSICLATYAAGLITLVGSTLIGHFIVQSCLPGTSLSPKQSANLQTNFMSTDLIDVSINTQSQEIRNDNLSISSSLIQDENVDYFIKTDNDDDITGWQWWLNSMMTWLPEYCILENDFEFTNSTKKLYITNAKFSFNSTQAMKIRKMEKIDKMKNFAPEDYRRNVNWKEALGNIIVSIKLIVGNGRVNSIMKVVQSSMSLNIYY